MNLNKVFAALLLVLCTTTASAAWKYGVDKDPMGRADKKWASTISVNTVRLNFPYNGPVRGRLTFRSSPPRVKDVLLEISKGQLYCAGEDCGATVRFDDGDPVWWHATGAEGGDSTTIFLWKEEDFMTRTQSAKKLMVEVQVYGNGRQIFTFDLKGLDWQ